MKKTSLLLTGLLVSPIANANPSHTPQFDLSLIHGGNQKAAQYFFDKSNQKNVFIAGTYILDVVVNGNKVSHQKLVINKTTKKLQLSSQWLDEAGININKSFYEKYFNSKTDSYTLTDQPETHIVLNSQLQAIFFTIPQGGLINVKKKIKWNEGHNALLLQYYLNGTKSNDEKTQVFSNSTFSANYHAWRLLGSLALDNNATSVSNIYLKRDIRKWKSDIELGQNNTRTEFYTSVPFTGVALYSNSNMLPVFQRSYAPIISGNAITNATITITQNGYILKQLNIPAGPYLINNLILMGNGNIHVKIHYANGQVVNKTYTVNTLPTLLRPKTTRYYVAAGVRKNRLESKRSNKIKFAIGEYSHGFSAATLISGGIIADHYQNVLLGATKSLGRLGAISLRDQASFAHYNENTHHNYDGQNLSLNYVKSFNTNTSIQISTHKYINNYVKFDGFDPVFSSDQLNNEKYSYDINLYQGLNYLNTGLQARYWSAYNFDGAKSQGATLYINTSYKKATISANISYAKNSEIEKDNLSASLSLTIPFGGNNNPYYQINPTYVTSSVSYNNQSSDPTYNLGVSHQFSNGFNYALNSSKAGNQYGLSAYTHYNFNQTSVGGSVYTNGQGGTTLSAQMNGSIIAIQGVNHNHLIFTHDTENTLAVVNLPKVPGVSFNGSSPTDSSGLTVVPLNSYQENMVTLNPTNLPNNIQLVNTSWRVFPTEGALTYKKFKYIKNTTYILQLISKNGFVVPFGIPVTTKTGQLVGYTQNHGILIVRIVGDISEIYMNVDGKIHKINLRNLKPNIDKIQEVKYV